MICRAHRHGRGERVDVRRRLGAGRGGADGAARSPGATQIVVVARRCTRTTARSLETYLAARRTTRCVDGAVRRRTAGPTSTRSSAPSTARPPRVIVGYPNFFGVVEDVAEAAALAHEGGRARHRRDRASRSRSGCSAARASSAPTSPSARGRASATRVSFGGPALGLFADARASSCGRCPAGSCGATVDKDGRRGFVLTLSTREQHIRREKATSNICTNAGLVRARRHDPHGAPRARRARASSRELSTAQGALRCATRSRARRASAALLRPVLQRVRVRARRRRARWSRALAKRGIARRASPLAALVSATLARRTRSSASRELHTPEHIELFAQTVEGLADGEPDRLEASMEKDAPDADARRRWRRHARLAYEEPLIFERGSPGRSGVLAARADVPRRSGARAPRRAAPRRASPGCPRSRELEVVRHFTRLSQLELRRRHRLLPARLLHDEVQPEDQRGAGAPARLRARSTRSRPTRCCAGRARAHVASSSERSPRSPASTRSRSQPAAGAQGELAGVMMIRAYHAGARERAQEGAHPRHARTARTPRRRALNGYEVVQLRVGRRRPARTRRPSQRRWTRTSPRS